MVTATQEEQKVNLPWVEKYRPATLGDLVSHTEIIQTLNRFIATDRLPHLLFYGPPGTGKTSTILAAARTMYTDKQRPSMVLELNASDDRGIGVVREEIVSFAQTRSLHSGAEAKGQQKLVILDEADAMTKDAQNALKRVIEKYTDNVRFCIICNYLSNIISPIQSRCTRFRFAPLTESLVSPRIDYVCEKEGLSLTEDGRRALLQLSGGDMRRVLNVMQSVSMAFSEASEATVYQCVGQPTPKQLEGILKTLLNDTFENCCKKLERDCLGAGFALADVVARLHDLVYELDVPSEVTIVLVCALAETERRLAIGASDRVQTAGLVGAFVKARAILADEIRK